MVNWDSLCEVVQYCKLGREPIRQGQSIVKELQVVCGGFVYVAMFRRALHEKV